MRYDLQTLKEHANNTDRLIAIKEKFKANSDLNAEDRSLFNRIKEQFAYSGDWSNLVALIDIELEWVSVESRFALLKEKARIYAEELFQTDDAMSIYQDALKIAKDDPDIEVTLEEIKALKDSFSDKKDKYFKEIGDTSDSALKANLWLSLVELVWKVEPNLEDIEGWLNDCLEADSKNRRASLLLERIYREAKRYKELIKLLDKRAKTLSSPEEKSEAWVSLGDIFIGSSIDEGAVNPTEEKAVEYYQRAFSLTPRYSRALFRLVEHMSNVHNYEALAQIYEEALRARLPSDRDLRMLIDLAEVYSDKLEDDEKAEEVYRRIRKQDPTQKDMLSFYRSYFRRRKEETKLLALLDSAQRVEKDDSIRMQLALEMVDLAESEVENLEKAIDITKGILRIGNEEQKKSATERLKRLYRQTNPPKWNALLDLLKEEIAQAKDEAKKLEVYDTIISIYRDYLKLDQMVINTYNAILEIKKDHQPALIALSELYESMNRWNDLVNILNRRKEIAAADDKIEILHQIVSLWLDRVSNNSQAILPLEEILSIDPLNEKALSALKEIHRKRRNWRALIDTVENEAKIRNNDRSRDLWVECAEIAALKLGDSGEAIERWNKLLIDNSKDKQALQALSELYRKEKRWYALIEVLHRLAEIAQSNELADEELSLLEQIGEIRTSRLSGDVAAVDVWKRVLELQAQHPKALALLRDLYVKQGAWDEVEALYIKRDDWISLAETFSNAADRSSDAEVKILLYAKVGNISSTQLENPERALKAYERVLAVDPTHYETSKALLPLYRQTERYSRLLSVYEALLSHAKSDAEKLSLLEEIRVLCEDNLHSKQSAFQWCAKAYEINPEDKHLNKELRRLAEESESWDELRTIYDARVEDLKGSEKKKMLERLAELSAKQLHRPEDAEKYHLGLLELNDSDEASLKALEEIYTSKQRWMDLVDVYRKQLAHLESGEKREKLLQIAFVQEERLADPIEAIDSYRTILDAEPENTKALRSLERLYRVRGEWKNLAEILKKELEIEDEEAKKVELFYALGDLYATEIVDLSRALDVFERVFTLEPHHRATVHSLEQLLDKEDIRVRVATLLEPIYQKAEDFEKLAEVLEILLKQEEDDEKAQAILKRLFTIYDKKLANASRARWATERLFVLNRADDDARNNFARLAEQTDRLDLFVEALKNTLPLMGDDVALEQKIRWDLAKTLDRMLSQPEHAEEHLRRLIELEPGHEDAYSMLERILRDRAKWTELRDLLHQRRDITNDSEKRCAILSQISAINEDVLGDNKAAILSYEEMLEIDPQRKDVQKALERHYRDAEMWNELADFYQQKLVYSDSDEERAEVKVKEAEVRSRELGEINAALDLLESVVSADCQAYDAISLLELMLTEDAEKRRITEILESVYEQSNRWKDYCSLLMIREGISEDPYEKVELLARVAKYTEEKLRDPQTAFQRYATAIRIDPRSDDLQNEIRRIAEEQERYESLVEEWLEVLEHLSDGDIDMRARLLGEVAELYDKELGDKDQAVDYYRELIALDPQSPQIAQGPSKELARLYEGAERWSELVDILRALLKWEEDIRNRGDYLLRIARIQEDVLEDQEESTITYRELLEEQSDSEEALSSLERLYVVSKNHRELIEILKRRIDRANQSDERRMLYHRISLIYREELDDLEEAAIALNFALDESTDDLEAIDGLIDIYTKLKRWPDLLEIVERKLSHYPSGPKHYEILFDAAEIQYRQLDDARGALERYRTLVENDTKHKGARSALRELLEEEEYALQICEIFMPIYRREENWKELIHLHEKFVDFSSSVGEQLEHLKTIERIQEDGLGDDEQALKTIRRALKLAAGEVELKELLEENLRISRSLKDYEGLVDSLEVIVNDILDTILRQRVHRICAKSCREELVDLERAEKHYRSLLDIDFEDKEALSALDDIYEQSEKWEKLLEVLSRRIDLNEDSRLKLSFLVRAADINYEQLDNTQEAIASYEQVRELDRANIRALDSLEKLYDKAGRHIELAELLNERADLEHDLEKRVAYYSRLATLNREELGEEEAAFDAYRALLALQPDHEETIERLEECLDDPGLGPSAAKVIEPIYVAKQDWRKLIRIYEIRLAEAEETNDRLALMKRMAELYEEQLEDLNGAFKWYGKVFLESPDDELIREQLLRLATITECWEDLVRIFGTYLDGVVSEDENSRHVALLCGDIYDEKLFKWEPARDNYQRILLNDPGDDEAFNKFEQLLIRHERWHEVIELYRSIVDATLDQSRRLDLMFKIARVYEEALEDYPAAIDAYRAIFDEENDRKSATALERLYKETEHWTDLTELISRKIDLAEEHSEAIELRYQLGRVYQNKITDFGAAIDHYEEVLAQEHNHNASIEALEELVMEKDHRFRISKILEPRYLDLDQWAKLVVIYDAQLEFIEEVDRRVFLLKEIARLHEEREGSLELAFTALSRAFEEAPSDEWVLDEVERLAEELECWPKAIEVIEKSAEASYDFDLQAQLYTRIAQLREGHLQDRKGAVEAWRKVLSVRDDDKEAMDALLQLLEIEGRYEELVVELHRKVEFSADVLVQQRTLEKIAEIYGEQLPDNEKAVEAWRQVLALDESSGRALDALEKLYQLDDDWLELIWVYQKKLELTDDPELWRDIQLQVAQTYEKELSDNFEAISAYKELHQRDSNDAYVLDSLDRLYTRENLWSDLLEIVERKADLVDGDTQNGLIYRAGAIYAKELKDIESAIDRFERVVESDPKHEAVRAALEELLTDEGSKDRVAGVLEGIYRREMNIDELIRVMEVRLEALSEPHERAELLRHLAELAEESLDDNRQAFEFFARAFREVPADETTHKDIDRLAEALDDRKALVELYRGEIEEIYDTELAYQINMKLAEMLRIDDDTAGAEKQYRAALECRAEDDRALKALDDVLLEQKKWKELLDILEMRANVVSDNESAQILYRIGEIQRKEFDDLDSAFAAYRRALIENERSEETISALKEMLDNENLKLSIIELLEPIYQARGDSAELIHLLKARYTTLSAKEERKDLLMQIGSLYGALSENDRALDTFFQALEEDPADEAIIKTIEPYAEDLIRFNDAISAIRVVLDKPDLDEYIYRSLAIKAGKWAEEKLSDEEKAIEFYTKVLKLFPNAEEALDALANIHRGRNDFQSLVTVLLKQAELVDDYDRKRTLLVEAARIKEDALEDSEGVVDVWEMISQLDDTDFEALTHLVRLYESNKSYGQMLEALQQLALLENDPDKRVGYLRKAGDLQRDALDDLNGSALTYQQAVDLDPTNIELLIALESRYRAMEDLGALEDVMLRRLDIVATDDRSAVLFELADLVKEDDPAKTTNYLQQVLESDPRNSEAFEHLERAYRNTEQWHELVDLLREQAGILTSEGDSQGAVRKLIAIARIWTDQLDDAEAATEVLEEVLGQDENNVFALAELARLYEHKEDWEKCLEVLEQAAALNPERLEAAELEFRRGRVVAAQKNSEEVAIEYYQKALELSPTHLDSILALEKIAREKKDWARVVQYIQARIEVASDDRLPLYIEVATIYQNELKDIDASLMAWEEARRLKDNDVEILVPLAEAYCQADRLEDAKPILEHLIATAKTKRGKDFARYEYLLGIVAKQQGDGAKALEHFEKAYRIDSTNGKILATLGEAYMAEQDWDAARRIYTSMLLQTSRDDEGVSRVDVFSALGKIHAAMGENAKAVTMFERGLELDPENNAIKDSLEALRDTRS